MCGWGEHLAVADDTVVRRLHFYRLGGQAVVEVFEYEAADQVRTPPRNSDVGGHHVALYVEEMDRAVAHLRALGRTVLGEPTASRGPSLGQRWVYFLAPWVCSASEAPGGLRPVVTPDRRRQAGRARWWDEP